MTNQSKYYISRNKVAKTDNNICIALIFTTYPKSWTMNPNFVSDTIRSIIDEMMYRMMYALFMHHKTLSLLDNWNETQ